MANWYVSQKVASSGAGTSLAVAKKTIAEAITASAANDTIYIYQGLYNEGDITITKNLSFIGVGFVQLNGSATKFHFVSSNSNITLTNFEFINYINYAFINTGIGKTISLYYNRFFNNIRLDGNQDTYNFYNNIFQAISFGGQNALQNVRIINNLFLTTFNIYSFHASFPAILRYNYFTGNTYLGVITYCTYSYNNFKGAVKFSSGGAYVACTTKEALAAKYLADTGNALPEINVLYTTSQFYTAIFNNSGKNNYTLKYDVANNPIAFATFSGNAIGAYQAAANIICKDTANSGNCDVYNITTDLYALGIFSGKTNVGVIDNVNEKLYRTTDGANNWGVFIASTELPKTHVIKNLQMFGTLIDKNGGQVTKLGSDFTYNYQIDVLVKWSDTLSKSALLAETSRPFVRFRLRPNETNYYVNNAGILVGDGEPTYLSLVNSSDGGSGSLVPTKVTAKSFVCIIILQDA